MEKACLVPFPHGPCGSGIASLYLIPIAAVSPLLVPTLALWCLTLLQAAEGEGLHLLFPSPVPPDCSCSLIVCIMENHMSVS